MDMKHGHYLIFFIAMVAIVIALLFLPVWPFRPCSLTIRSKIVELPELNGPTFGTALEQILRQFDEPHCRIGNRILVPRSLAFDAENRSKYTAEAISNAERSNPSYRPLVSTDKTAEGLLLGNLLTNRNATNQPTHRSDPQKVN
jgi:hypothetical protein